MKKYKRFFAFGCSFTKYKWISWADILGKSFKESYNFGLPGVGNFYIFAHLIKIINDYEINENDLVIVQWSGLTREDRFYNGSWNRFNDLYNDTQQLVNNDFISYILDIDHCLIRDYTFIASAYEILEKTKCKFIFTSMIDFSEVEIPYTKNMFKIKTTKKNEWVKSFEKYMIYFLPSFKKSIFNNKWPQRNDPHPTPLEHLEFVKKILIPNIDSDIVIDKDFINEINVIDYKVRNPDAKL